MLYLAVYHNMHRHSDIGRWLGPSSKEKDPNEDAGLDDSDVIERARTILLSYTRLLMLSNKIIILIILYL